MFRGGGPSSYLKDMISPAASLLVRVPRHLSFSLLFLTSLLAIPSVVRGKTCEVCGKSSTYTETLDYTGIGRRFIEASGCPNHFSECQKKSCSGGFTESSYMNYSERVPLYPVLTQNPSNTTCRGGPLAYAFNGVAIFGPGDGTDACNDAVNYEGATFDACGGHSTGFDAYHYHMPPSCLLSQLDSPTGDTSHSPQLGWALDGFPVYGGEGPGGVSMVPCSLPWAHSTYCLDTCGGYEGEIDADEFTYRYYIAGPVADSQCSEIVLNSDSGTCDSNAPEACCSNILPNVSYYPYTIGCFKGCMPNAIRLGSCDSRGDGYTSSYVPEAVVPDLSVYTGLSSATTVCEASVPIPAPSPSPSHPATRAPSHAPTQSFAPSVPSISSSPTPGPVLGPSPLPTPFPTPKPGNSTSKQSDDDSLLPFIHVSSSLFAGASLIWFCLAVAICLGVLITGCRLCAKRRAGEAKKTLDGMPRFSPADRGMWMTDEPTRPSSTVVWQENEMVGRRDWMGQL